eukprot:TRINITY_DN70920_c1_g1_i1.p1 TRINITY_DN70920_c1_g1~~TRINITY_DN70920_c1_g1_i1.p1  ORF type:complete len:325 (+),score=50.82 TRINITY_DN70920_c1_g1_i1:91-1065(+)
MSGTKRGRGRGRSKKPQAEPEEEKKVNPEPEASEHENEASEDESKKPSKILKEDKKDDISAAASKKAKRGRKPGKKEGKEEGKRKKRTAPKKAGGPAVNSEEKDKILAYMKEQNRPYSALNVFDNLHGEIKKADVQKILDSLVKDGEVQSKDFGKFVVYLVNQDKMPTVPQEELNNMDKEIDECREKLKQLSEELKEKHKGRLLWQIQKRQHIKRLFRHFQIKSQLERLRLQLKRYLISDQLENQNEELEADLKGLRENTIELVEENNMKEAENNVKQFMKEWVKRRKGCWETLDMISEGMEKPIKEVFVFCLFSQICVGVDRT